MRLLLDECIDRRLAREFHGHIVQTVPKMGWAGIKNGRLLALAAKEFDAFITVDCGLSFQQNLSEFDLVVVLLRAKANDLTKLRQLVPELLARLPHAKPGALTLVGE